jgi:hypothetical protein
MEFDKSKGFCDGVNVKEKGCDFTFHSLRHTQDEIILENCKKCSCPPARSHRKVYQEERRGIVQ